MAEFGAHLTSTQSGGDKDRPSVFEVLAQENLMKTLQPAITYAVQVLAQKNPTRYGFLLRYSEELYASLGLLLQHYYLKNFSASFAENFYTMKRVRSRVGKSGDETLTRNQQLRSLLCLVLVPYLKTKLERAFEERRDAEQRYQQGAGRLTTSRLLVKLFPLVHTIWEATILYYQLAYIFRRSKVHSPLLAIAGVSLKILNDEDILFQEAALTHTSSNKRSMKETLSSFLQWGLGIIALGVSSGLSVSMFFLQFLEWWYTSETKMTSLTSLPIPPPPRKLECEGLPSLPNLCPLCLQLRTNDTALATSGLVFCYPCIYKYVTQYQRCPKTGYPSNSDQLIKLYLTDQ